MAKWLEPTPTDEILDAIQEARAQGRVEIIKEIAGLKPYKESLGYHQFAERLRLHADAMRIGSSEYPPSAIAGDIDKAEQMLWQVWEWANEPAPPNPKITQRAPLGRWQAEIKCKAHVRALLAQTEEQER